MTRVAVVGAGISGLAAAWRLTRLRPDLEVVVLEAAATVGGKLASGAIAGITVDVGAEALLTRRPEAVGLIDELELAGERIDPSTTAASLRVGGGRRPLPARTLLGIPGDPSALRASGAVSDAAAERAAAEPSAPPLNPLTEDVAVGALVRARLGNEIVDRLVDPLLGGVYAGRADELSLRATMPALAARLASGGSLVEAASAATDPGSRPAATGPVFTSLRGGVARLATTLAGGGSFTVRTNTTVREIRRTASGFELRCGPVPETQTVATDAVILATPAAKAARLLRGLVPVAATELDEVQTASLAIVTLAFGQAPDLPGSGLLVGVREGFAVKAITVSSQKWPLDTGGLTVLRASVGRAGEPEALQRDDEDLVALVRHELRGLIGVTDAPVDALVTRWGGGLPQYSVGHVERVSRIRAAVASLPGLAVCGATYDGIGVPACIGSANAAADRIVAALAPAGARGTMDA